jgi:murein DD-endopeptidase MepM/ murein hydrolase activator NlpD
MRKLVLALLLLALIAAGVYVGAGSLAGPAVEIVAPQRFVGLASPLEILIDVPDGRLSALSVEFEQNGTRTPLAGIADAAPAADGEAAARLRVARTIGRDAIPGLESGAGRIVVTASRPVVHGIRDVETVVIRDVEVRLERPRAAVLSTHHYVNQGGAELVVYRVAPEDVRSGVMVGDLFYPGYPAAGIEVGGARITDSAVRVAFFALLHDQPVDVPIRLVAEDEAGNSGTASFDYRTFPKPFKNSRIELEDRFLERVVPAILTGTTEVAPDGPLIDQYVVINSELRRLNAARIGTLAAESAPELLWGGAAFHPFTNNAVESAFADRRTYYYKGREVDRQVHLGFDLASYAQTPIVAANRGRVLFADELGIYGNTVIIDHGMGLQSLYAHLSSIEVTPGTAVEKNQPIGRSGMTGLAGGDHLHFTMLLNGQMINPVEWWDAHWIEDRIVRKLRAAAAR